MNEMKQKNCETIFEAKASLNYISNDEKQQNNSQKYIFGFCELLRQY